MKPFTAIAALIFGVMALIHAYRIAVGFPINVAGADVGQGVSWIALIVTAALSYGLFREARP